MGNWTITIVGTGAHHNKDYEGDADKIFKETVEKLKEVGQNVEHASFTYGGRNMEKPNFESFSRPEK
jgi:hypothetical protein